MASRPASARSRKSASGAEPAADQPQASSAKSRSHRPRRRRCEDWVGQSRGQLAAVRPTPTIRQLLRSRTAGELVELGSQAAIMPA
uniref:GntR family transcriptional regulator n=1 Tax=Macrostomum lignano TaxID=282301 RepID=A0A1I8FPU0_9PLAT